MTLGRTSDNKIKIKTDEAGGGLRAVECACCGPIDPCQQCQPVNKNFTFSLSGDQVDGLFYEYQDDPTTCCMPIRTCVDSWSGMYLTYFTDYGMNFAMVRSFGVYLRRAIGGVFGADHGAGCCWVLTLGVNGSFRYTFMGLDDICNVQDSKNITILGDNPEGTYNFTFYGQCLPPPYQSSPTQFPFNFTVTIS